MHDKPLDRYSNPNYRRYVLFMLTTVYAFNFIDRQLLVILQESIKQEMGLSDTALGLLTGFAFVIIYVLAGIPIARLADRSNRRTIVACALGVWSFMTAITGFAGNFVQLLMARVGVGLGEAGCTPPAHSMISDMYPAEKRGTAIATYSVGINIGILFGFLFGGILNEYYGWRVAFMVVGAPGILLAIFFRLTIAEPIRESHDAITDKQEPQTVIPMREVVRTLFRNKALLHMFLGAALSSMVGYISINWFASYFIRSHGMGTASLGVWLSIAAGVFGGAGTYLAGVIADKLGLIDRRWYLWVPCIAALIAIPFQLIVLTSSNPTVGLVGNCLFSFVSTVYLAPSVAVLHGLVKSRMRAVSSAYFYLVVNIVGLGIGPPLIGMISDALADSHGQESLRYAMLYVSPFVCAWAAAHMFIAAKHLGKQQSV